MDILKTEEIKMVFGGLLALNNVSIHIEEGEIVGIIGPNGAGKTTLFNIITGIYIPTSGKVELLGTDITGFKPHKITILGFSRTFQNIRLFNRMTVLENVLMGTCCRTKANFFDIIFKTRKKQEEDIQSLKEANEILDILKLQEKKYQMPNSLPYGEQRRLEIARALATKPKMLLLDEPAAGMNEQETMELLLIIKSLQKMGYTILLIEHDMKFVMNICERIYVLNYGEIIAEGTPSKIQKDSLVIEAYLGKEVIN